MCFGGGASLSRFRPRAAAGPLVRKRCLAHPACTSTPTSSSPCPPPLPCPSTSPRAHTKLSNLFRPGNDLLICHLRPLSLLCRLPALPPWPRPRSSFDRRPPRRTRSPPRLLPRRRRSRPLRTRSRIRRRRDSGQRPGMALPGRKAAAEEEEEQHRPRAGQRRRPQTGRSTTMETTMILAQTSR